MEKCELPHCLQCPSDWRMLFWKSEGLQTGLGKHIVSTLAFYFLPCLAAATPPCTPHTNTHPSQGPVLSLPLAASHSPFVFHSRRTFSNSFCQLHLFETLESYQQEARLWLPTARASSSVSHCPILCPSTGAHGQPWPRQELQPPLPLLVFAQTSCTVQWLSSAHSNCFIAPIAFTKCQSSQKSRYLLQRFLTQLWNGIIKKISFDSCVDDYT